MSSFPFRRLALGGAALAGLAALGGSSAQAQAYDNGYDAPSPYDNPPVYQGRDSDEPPAYSGPGSDERAYAPPPGYASPAYDEPGYDQPGYSAEEATTVGGVIVRAPRRERRDPATGAPIEWVSASRVVRYDDLDLDTGWGAHALRVRIERAAHDACDELESRYVTVDSDDTACERNAVRDALYQTPLADNR
jgi:UrcA family protein